MHILYMFNAIQEGRSNSASWAWRPYFSNVITKTYHWSLIHFPGRVWASVRDASLCMREMSRDVHCLEIFSPENREMMRLNSMRFLSREIALPCESNCGRPSFCTSSRVSSPKSLYSALTIWTVVCVTPEAHTNTPGKIRANSRLANRLCYPQVPLHSGGGHGAHCSVSQVGKWPQIRTEMLSITVRHNN